MTMKKKSFLEKISGSEKNKSEKEKSVEVNNYEEEINDIMKENIKFENYDDENVEDREKEVVEAEKGVDRNDANKENDVQDWDEKENIEEGQLTVDVYKTKDLIVIKSIIGGVRPEDLDISVTSDMVTIKGKRVNSDEVIADDYYYQECFWGNFSRSIILPDDIKTDGVEAIIKNGILTLNLPKIEKNSLTKIKVIEE
ncbi:MAG: Hsp20/alpha crystallin family protein [Candidatus Pacebacteria bacterium]|nr:Hsp20/alpha crystallin family protein [Candidatus Paceibacterota bacterium]